MNDEPARAWAVRHWNGGLYVETIRRTRAEAIASFKEQFGVGDAEWRDDAKYGVHRAVHVLVLRVRRA